MRNRNLNTLGKWSRRRACVAALLLGMIAAAADAQTTIRITRGDGATVLPSGPYFRLTADPTGGSNLLHFERNRICCPAAGADARTRCVSERQVPLGASRADVVERYGPPGNGSTTEVLRYSGIEFVMHGGRVTQICAVR